MKKLLTVLIALSMIVSGFAVEPIASTDMLDLSADASVTFGVDLETGKTGFDNETNIDLYLNFFDADSTWSNDGSGIWGELVVLLDGDARLMEEVDNGDATLDSTIDGGVFTIDVAKLHINDFYVGFERSGFAFGDDFLFPNALNYDDGDDADTGFVYNESKDFATYTDGIVAGYSNDLFTVEAYLNTEPGVTNSLNDYEEHKTILTNADKGDTVTLDHWGDPSYKYYLNGTEISADDVSAADVYTLPNDGSVYEVLLDGDANFWTNNYAIGGKIEVTPVTGLRAAYGIGYGIEGTEKGNVTMFAGADYSYKIDDQYSIVPAVAWSMYKEDGVKEPTSNKLGAGINFRWAPSEDGNSPVYDFFDDYLVYEDGDGNDDDDLLPGVSVTALFDLTKDAMKTDLPIIAEVYTGSLISNLKVAGMFHINVAPDAAANAYTKAGGTDAAYEFLDEGLKNGLQGAVAAYYDVAVGDLTVTPGAGVLVRYANMVNGDDSVSLTSVMPAVNCSVAGLVPNTTFSAEWSGADFQTYNYDLAGVTGSAEGITPMGELKVTATIAL